MQCVQPLAAAAEPPDASSNHSPQSRIFAPLAGSKTSSAHLPPKLLRFGLACMERRWLRTGIQALRRGPQWPGAVVSLCQWVSLGTISPIRHSIQNRSLSNEIKGALAGWTLKLHYFWYAYCISLLFNYSMGYDNPCFSFSQSGWRLDRCHGKKLFTWFRLMHVPAWINPQQWRP